MQLSQKKIIRKCTSQETIFKAKSYHILNIVYKKLE